jgi:hypothetical protein
MLADSHFAFGLFSKIAHGTEYRFNIGHYLADQEPNFPVTGHRNQGSFQGNCWHSLLALKPNGLGIAP